jgi:hypothetical protein
MQIQAQGSSHDHCHQEKNETNTLNDKIKELEAANSQKSTEIVQLNQKISQ